AYDIDEKKMKRRFLQVQRDVHPDGFGRKSKTEQQCADLQSSLLNKAFQTLRDPLSRAKYLLSLNHLSLAEHEGLSDPHLLMEVMEIREALEEASSQHEVDNIKTENDQRIAETVQRLSDAFRSHDLEIAKKLTAQLQYWMNIKNVIRD
ncbi:HSCB C-terminal oligomerization domain-containing protein, partial [Gaertneriomyces semiglobifer]